MSDAVAPGLHLGDGVTWLEAQPAASLDGIFTDPPWGSGPKIEGQANWQDLTCRVARAAEYALRPHGHCIFWFGQGQMDTVARMVLTATTLHWNALLFIDYFPHTRFMARYATVDVGLVFSPTRFAPPRGKPYAFPYYVCRSKPLSGDAYLCRMHSCARSVEVVGEILRDWFSPGDVIADPFAGTDTTGYQARRLGLACYSFEIDPAKHALAEERHRQRDLFAPEEVTHA